MVDRHTEESKAHRYRRWWSLFIAVVALYILVASGCYRFSHPEQSETELFLNLLDAFLWR